MLCAGYLCRPFTLVSAGTYFHCLWRLLRSSHTTDLISSLEDPLVVEPRLPYSPKVTPVSPIHLIFHCHDSYDRFLLQEEFILLMSL